MNLLIPIVFTVIAVIGYFVFTKKSPTVPLPNPTPEPSSLPPTPPIPTPSPSPEATSTPTPTLSPCFLAAVFAENNTQEGWVDYAPCGEPLAKKRLTLYAFDHITGEWVANLCVNHVIGSYNATVNLTANDCSYVFPTPVPTSTPESTVTPAVTSTPAPTPTPLPVISEEHTVIRFAFNGYEEESQVTPDKTYVPSLGRAPRTLAECPLAFWFATEEQAIHAGIPKPLPVLFEGTLTPPGTPRVWESRGVVNADHTLKTDSWRIITEVV